MLIKPGEKMRMMYYSVMTQANSEKENPSAPIRVRVSFIYFTIDK